MMAPMPVLATQLLPAPEPRRRLGAWCAAAVLCGLAAPIAALPQAPASPPPTAAGPVLVLQNLAPYPRAEIAAVVVPFAPGAVREPPDLHVPGAPTAWVPFGARWPDGSLRHARCLFRVELAALEERRVALVAGPGPALPADELPACTVPLVVVAKCRGREHRATPTTTAVLERSPLRTVELRTARLGDSGLVAELLLTQGRDQPFVALDAAVFHSDPNQPQFDCPLEQLAIESPTAPLAFRHAGRLGVRHEPLGQGTRAIWLERSSLGDGQGLRRLGAVLLRPAPDQPPPPAAVAAALAPLCGATAWGPSGAFGAFGVVPELPPWLAGPNLRQHLATRHRAFVAGDQPGGDPFAAGPLGPAKNAGQTGDQHDFGVVKLSLVAHSGLPSLLFEAEASVLQEACRPVHCFEADGSPVLPERHPDWVVWSGRTHWHPEVSRDRLGKPAPEPPFESHGWTGKDREHWSSNLLGSFALLTGAHWAIRELEHEARLYRAGQTLDPQLTTSGAGPARAAGRTQLAATWMYLATGDPLLRARIDARVDQIEYPQWAGRTLGSDRVRPFAVASPDARMLGGQTEYWTPWQEALAVLGFAAVFHTTGNPRARELAEVLSRNTLRFGYRQEGPVWWIATALRWQDGRPLSAAEAGDPAAALWSHGTGFTEWSAGCVAIGGAAAIQAGETELAARAAAILRQLQAARVPPAAGTPDAGGIDRYAEWAAVRWP